MYRPLPIPVCDAPAGLLPDCLWGSPFFCKDDYNHGDILYIYSVAGNRIYNTINERIDDDFYVEHGKTDPIYKNIDNKGHLSYAKTVEFFCKIESKYVLSAARASAA